MRQQQGLTLIEVLIALAIIGIAIMAIVQTTSQNIKNTAYLKQKSCALWVANLALNEARLELVKLPLSPEKFHDKAIMLGQTWYWEGWQQTTSNPHIRKIVIKVYQNPQAAEEEKSLFTLQGYTKVIISPMKELQRE